MGLLLSRRSLSCLSGGGGGVDAGVTRSLWPRS